MTALAIPAASMMPVAPAAQRGITKVAPGSTKDGVNAPEADLTENHEPFHSLMQELSATEEKPATQSPRHVLPPANEKPKAKPAKRDTNDDPAASLPAAQSAQENKPPVVWSLPQIPAIPEATSQEAAVGYGRADVENDAARGITGNNRPKPAAKSTAQLASQGESQALPLALPQESPQGRQLTSPSAATASEAAAQASAIETEDSSSAAPVASAVPAAPFGDTTTAKVAFEARLRPVQTDAVTEQRIGPEPRSAHVGTTSPTEIQTSAIEPQSSPLADPLASTASTSIDRLTTATTAFEGHSRPILPVQTAALEIGSQPHSIEREPSSFRQQAQEPSNSPRPAAVAAPAEKHNDNQRDQPERQPKSAAPSDPQAASISEAAPHVETAPSAAANLVNASMAMQAPAVSSASAPAVVPAPPAPHTAAATADVAPTADPPPSPAAANDIKIALNDNGQRVELRVTERAGDIHVTVRTPDSQLATAMREDLPALSSKLEQSGLHSEMWRPAASASSENRAIETSGGNASPDSREQSGSRQQQEGQQQDPRNLQQTLNRKSDRKEFSWLFESIR